MNTQKLIKLGFTIREIELVNDMMNRGIAVTSQRLINMGFNPVQIKRLRYLKDILEGKVDVDSKDGLVKHAKKMNPSARRLHIEDFAVSKIEKVPRYALIGGIKDKCYELLNSKNYTTFKDKYYNVEAVNSRIVVSTDKKIVLKNGYAKKIDNVLELLGKSKSNGKNIIAIDKSHCKLCNRYIIVASLRRPEFHLGMYEIIAVDGTLVYVYAKDIGTKANLNYQGGNARVYDYGIKKASIDKKLERVTKVVHKGVRGVKVYKVDANQEFKELDLQPKKEIEVEE